MSFKSIKLNPGKTFSNISDLSAKYMSESGLVKNLKYKNANLEATNWGLKDRSDSNIGVILLFLRLGPKEKALEKFANFFLSLLMMYSCIIAGCGCPQIWPHLTQWQPQHV